MYRLAVEHLLQAKEAPLAGGNSVDRALSTVVGGLVVLSDVSARGIDRMTALHYAAYYGHVYVARILLNRGADATAQDQWKHTPLHLAVAQGHEGVVHFLLVSGADTSTTDLYGQTPLHYAVYRKYNKVARILLDNRANISLHDIYKKTPLHFATDVGEVMVKLLLSKGVARAVVSAQDDHGETPLHIAAGKLDCGAVEALVDAGTDVSIQDCNGKIALHIASSRGNEIMVQLLLKAGVDPSICEINGRTALHVSANGGFGAVTKLLLGGVDLSIRDIAGHTALDDAIFSGHAMVVQILLEEQERSNRATLIGKGEDPSVLDSTGLLNRAVVGGHNNLIRFLLEKGVDPSIRDAHGSTALHSAVGVNFPMAAQLILARGVDISIPDRGGATALQLAISNGYTALVQMITKSLVEQARSSKVARNVLYSAVHSCSTGGQAGGVLSALPLTDEGTEVSLSVDKEDLEKFLFEPLRGNNHEAPRWAAIDFTERGLQSTAFQGREDRYLSIGAAVYEPPNRRENEDYSWAVAQLGRWESGVEQKVADGFPIADVGEEVNTQHATLEGWLLGLETILNESGSVSLAAENMLRSVFLSDYIGGQDTEIRLVELDDQALSALGDDHSEVGSQAPWWEEEFFRTWADSLVRFW